MRSPKLATESSAQLQIAEWTGLDDNVPIADIISAAEALAETTTTHCEAFRAALKKAKAILG